MFFVVIMLLLILLQLAIFLRNHYDACFSHLSIWFFLLFCLTLTHLFLFVFAVLLSRPTALEASCVASRVWGRKTCPAVMIDLVSPQLRFQGLCWEKSPPVAPQLSGQVPGC